MTTPSPGANVPGTDLPPHGVLASTRYLPRLRLERSAVLAQHQWMAPGLRGLAKGRRTIAGWDEDVVTMAVQATRQLKAALPATQAQGLTLVSTSLPFAERSNAAIVAAATGVADTATVRDVTSTARAAIAELAALLDRPTATHHLLVAAERRLARPASTQEMVQGDGAAAVLVGRGAALATLVASATVHADLVDRFRENGRDQDYGWEERWVRDEGYMKVVAGTVRRCLEQAGVQPAEVAHFVLPAPLPKVNDAVARKVGIRPEAVLPSGHEDGGDLGSAQPLAMLDVALRLAAPGALLMVAAFGSGCDAVLLRRTGVEAPGGIPDAGVPETSYLKYLSFTGQVALDWGMRAEMDNRTAQTAAWREHGRSARFEGGRCAACGTVQFPGSGVCVAPQCRTVARQQVVSLADIPARILSHTTDFLAYTPHPPFQFGHVDFDGGARVLMEFTDANAGELSVGLPVRMVYRIKEFDRQRGFRRYFWKATPVRGATPGEHD